MPEQRKIVSPCRLICRLDPAARLCVGCGRTLDEIARWLAFTPAERDAIMAALPARLAAEDAASRRRAAGP
jgi:predicted Fe-S protein YdhL (DUF1289 family)